MAHNATRALVLQSSLGMFKVGSNTMVSLAVIWFLDKENTGLQWDWRN